ncbi:3-deoxy-D-manno-octulosonic acid transferase [Planctomicrobium sp. SH527]|uniref:3-deoxy-D-manno-octulosonic acid transferase n=1 Tax=Planctomicrobium sp. SH527 TaxID=3448123 RepID=UPI003F5B8F60
MLSLFFNLCYGMLILLLSPLILWKRIRTGKYRKGFDQKFWGRLPERTDFSTPLIWLHAVSVGEVLQLRQVIAGLKEACPNGLRILVTTTTDTGFAVATEKLTDCQVAYFPLDFSWAVKNALKRVQPDYLVLVELELWPNLIRIASRRRIPLLLINGRLSAKSFSGYHRIRFLVSHLLARFSLIAVQSEEYQKRFLALGAPPESTVATGSIKFDGVVTDRQNERTIALRQWMQIQPDEQVFIAGSTQEPEEEIALNVYAELLDEFPKLRLIIVPRHPERGDSIARLIQDRSFPLLRRSVQKALTPSTPRSVVLLDTVGELGACWGLADVAFVGGSFGNRGGQNMLEPAAYGAAVCYGPNTSNFRQVVELLEQHQATVRTRSPEELKTFVRSMLNDRQQAETLGHRAREVVLAQQGATARTVALIVNKFQQS